MTSERVAGWSCQSVAGSSEYAVPMILETVYSLAGAFLLAFCAYKILIMIVRWLGHQRQQHFVLVIGVIALTLGAA